MVPTEPLWLTRAQEKAMMELHRLNFSAISSLPPAVTNELSVLERQLDEAIARVGGVAFIKCGKKSCMDYAMRIENRKSKRILESLVTQGLDDLVRFQAQSSKLSDSVVFNWCQGMVRSMAVPSGFDAIDTVSRSMLASYSLNPALGSVLFVRQFVNLDPCLQFRVFIYNDKVNAITQKYAIYSPWLNKYAEKVSNALQNFVESRILPEMEDHPSFCVDLSIVFNHENGSKSNDLEYMPYGLHFKESDTPFGILLMQFIPFFPRAVNGLFEWSRDRNILTDGPFELRIRRAPTTVITSGDVRFEQGTPLIARYWLDTMQQELKSSILHRRLRTGGKILLVALLLLVLYIFFLR